MKTFAFDTETVLTRPGCKAPPLVCLTWQRPEDARPSIVHHTQARPIFEAALRDPQTILVGHFVAYDLGVCAAAWPDLIPVIFQAYEDNRVTDTMLREKLWDIATGAYRGFADDRGVWRKHDYNLDSVARRRAGIALKKDGWRKRYGEVRDLPLAQWPAYAARASLEAKTLVDAGVKDKDLEAVANGDPNEILIYPLEDARATLATYLSQETVRKGCDPDPFVDEFRQARASWWLTLMSSWGLRTHAAGVHLLKLQTAEAIEQLTADLVAAGLVRKDGTRDTKAATARMLEVCGWGAITVDGKDVDYRKTRTDARPFRKTKGGGVSLDRDACKSSDDAILIDYGDRAQLKAVLDKDVPMLEAGIHFPVHTRIDIAASGRTTSSAPNIQNLRRLPGIREAFIPRPGMVYAQADYPGLELRTLAQVCFDLFGDSALGRALNAGLDPHLAMGASMIGISYGEAVANKKRKDVKAARDAGKVANFGFPGGLGAEKLCLFAAKTYGVILTVAEAKELKRAWLAQWPEMREFFAYVGRLCDNPKGEATILQLRSYRMRGGATYTAACNTWFQGLGADATKAAGFAIAKACYVDKASPLYGSRIANYIHDEFICETRDRPEAHEAAVELARIMRDAANEWLPNVPFKADEPDPQLMRLWSKDAEAFFDERGRLVPWEPGLAGVIKMGQAIAARVPNIEVAA